MYLSTYQRLQQCLQERCLGLGLSERSSCPVGTPCPSLARTPSVPQWHSLHYAPGGDSNTHSFSEFVKIDVKVTIVDGTLAASVVALM